MTWIPVGITQRVTQLPSRGRERRDCLDQMWAQLLDGCRLVAVPVPNGLAEPDLFAERAGLEGLIMSGGNNLTPAFGTHDGSRARVPLSLADTAPERDRTESALLKWASAKSVPVLGVCRGAQALNVFHGGSIRPVEGHAGNLHALEVCSPPGTGFPVPDEAMSYHDFGMREKDLAPELTAMARSGPVIEAFVHAELPQVGVMWHPERHSPPFETDIQLLRDLFA